MTHPGILDDKGRCCGRKPMVYKSRTHTGTDPHRYCPRCDRAYDLEGNRQIPNWAWRRLPDGSFVSNTNRDRSAEVTR